MEIPHSFRPPAILPPCLFRSPTIAALQQGAGLRGGGGSGLWRSTGGSDAGNYVISAASLPASPVQEKELNPQQRPAINYIFSRKSGWLAGLIFQFFDAAVLKLREIIYQRPHRVCVLVFTPKIRSVFNYFSSF
jgi:hypothetical protein